MAEYKQPPPSYNDPPQQMYPPQAGYNQPPMAGYTQQPMSHNHSTASHTTVIVNQPRPGAPGAAPRMWSTGICGICEDIPICLCGTFLGLCLACQVSTDMGESACVPCCVPGADITMRTKWRTQENIQGSILDDCMTVWCCGPCAMCQLAREVQAKKNGVLYPSA